MGLCSTRVSLLTEKLPILPTYSEDGPQNGKEAPDTRAMSSSDTPPVTSSGASRISRTSFNAAPGSDLVRTTTTLAFLDQSSLPGWSSLHRRRPVACSTTRRGLALRRRTPTRRCSAWGYRTAVCHHRQPLMVRPRRRPTGRGSDHLLCLCLLPIQPWPASLASPAPFLPVSPGRRTATVCRSGLSTAPMAGRRSTRHDNRASCFPRSTRRIPLIFTTYPAHTPIPQSRSRPLRDRAPLSQLLLRFLLPSTIPYPGNRVNPYTIPTPTLTRIPYTQAQAPPE